MAGHFLGAHDLGELRGEGVGPGIATTATSTTLGTLKNNDLSKNYDKINFEL
jgi:hypothetical protein